MFPTKPLPILETTPSQMAFRLKNSRNNDKQGFISPDSRVNMLTPLLCSFSYTLETVGCTCLLLCFLTQWDKPWLFVSFTCANVSALLLDHKSPDYCDWHHKDYERRPNVLQLQVVICNFYNFFYVLKTKYCENKTINNADGKTTVTTMKLYYYMLIGTEYSIKFTSQNFRLASSHSSSTFTASPLNSLSFSYPFPQEHINQKKNGTQLDGQSKLTKETKNNTSALSKQNNTVSRYNIYRVPTISCLETGSICSGNFQKKNKIAINRS